MCDVCSNCDTQAVLTDLVAGVVNTVLFVRPLLKVHRAVLSAGGSNRHSRRLQALAFKQGILSSIAVFSTILALFCVAVFNLYAIFIPLDYVVSCGCIILMYSWNQWIAV